MALKSSHRIPNRGYIYEIISIILSLPFSCSGFYGDYPDHGPLIKLISIFNARGSDPGLINE